MNEKDQHASYVHNWNNLNFIVICHDDKYFAHVECIQK